MHSHTQSATHLFNSKLDAAANGTLMNAWGKETEMNSREGSEREFKKRCESALRVSCGALEWKLDTDKIRNKETVSGVKAGSS